MKSIVRMILLLFLVCLSGTVFAQWSPFEWPTLTQNYAASADRVFAAALKSIQAQKREFKALDLTNHIADFRIGVAELSWGRDVRLTVTPTTVGEVHVSRVTVGVIRSGGDALSWESDKMELRKILVGIETELTSAQ